ncbi:MAG: alpha-L-rhamnosidase C-terminal domain-containing protein, partial [Ilumatobacteraceae bacterium]
KHSLNHYSKGAVISFLHRYVAGLQPLDPGYRTFAVAPRPGGRITRARTHHETPHGRIDVEWQIRGDVGTVTVAVPVGTEANVTLPDGWRGVLEAGDHELTWEDTP